ncbi:outer membrane protein transport protein [Sansalvadorimonas sp. 2012CJ34-2]|uniref:Outer membrane protein transport protein n=1 Tax=Parendozoicomonas callyspongiae TaxID=2942213 RepID=A0ABT0PD50_9GAMM|nr:outer membrane protein transport protein [Sansalvadorimonas sp. 2012CJ34-2]MCL6268672.1 outer membrane protein transport protein [Sansalvadorimonas sp. 2012CJ34-2]
MSKLLKAGILCRNGLMSTLLATGGCFAVLPGISQGAGLSLVDFNSISALGTAGAGRGVNRADASIISSNPAGMSFFSQPQTNIGFIGAFAGGDAKGHYSTITEVKSFPTSDPYFGWKGDYQSCKTPWGDSALCYGESGKSDNFLHPAAIPSIYYAQPLQENLWAGFAVYGAFGGETHYPIDSIFRYQALDSSIKVINLQPTVSWKVNDELSLGAGIWTSFGKIEMSRMLNPWASAVTDAVASINGDGFGLGTNLGLIWNPVEPLTVGLSYHSPTKIKFKGDLKATGVAGLTTVLNQFVTESDDYPVASASAAWISDHKPGTLTEHTRLSLTFPEHIDLSLAWDVDPQWSLLASAIWTRWSRFEKFQIKSEGGRASDIVSASNGAPGGHIVAWVPQDWSDTWTMSFGTLWNYSDRLTLRAGYALDNSPTSNTTRSARIPDNDRQWLTFGAGYRVNEQYSLDLAYGYMMMKPFRIHDANHKVDGSIQGTVEESAPFEDQGHLTARYKKMHAHMLAAQLTVRF